MKLITNKWRKAILKEDHTEDAIKSLSNKNNEQNRKNCIITIYMLNFTKTMVTDLLSEGMYPKMITLEKSPSTI